MPSSRRPPVALAKAMQSLTSSFQSALLPITDRKDFWSRSWPSWLKWRTPAGFYSLFSPSIQHDQEFGGQCLRTHGSGVRTAVHLDQAVALQVTQGARQVAGRAA